MDDLISRQAAIDGKICIQRANGVEIYDDYAVPVEYLKQLPPASCSEFPNNSDTISRQAAIDAFNTNVDELVVAGKENADSVEKYLNRVLDKIKQLPPIQPKRGRWVLVCDNNGMHFICNKCGAWRYHQEQKFCGECGADMREKGENNESN